MSGDTIAEARYGEYLLSTKSMVRLSDISPLLRSNEVRRTDSDLVANHRWQWAVGSE